MAEENLEKREKQKEKEKEERENLVEEDKYIFFQKIKYILFVIL